MRAIAHHEDMLRGRTTLVVALALAALAAFVLLQGGCSRQSGAPPASGGDGPYLARSTTPPVVTADPSAAPSHSTIVASAVASAGARRLEAVRTIDLFCTLVDSHRLHRAIDLLKTPRVFSRRKLRALEAFSFRSARVLHARRGRALKVLTRVWVRSRRECPLSDGINTLTFTLGRAGNTAGSWLISAVTPSP
jgi:hypothetical protein